MSDEISVISNDVQDRSSPAWRKLCDYVDKVAAEGRDEFAPMEELGPEMFAQIHTLPETIAELKSVKKLWLYGSSLVRIPPEIGEMDALEYLDPYTSYNLHWFPYEITHCKKLSSSRVSTRALYGNFKNRMTFPSLVGNPVRYTGDSVKCSICKRQLSYSQIIQVWISLRVGTDVLPLLANLCSVECQANLQQPPRGYVQWAHKGGDSLQQPTYEDWAAANAVKITGDELDGLKRNNEDQHPKLLKVIRKLWDKS